MEAALWGGVGVVVVLLWKGSTLGVAAGAAVTVGAVLDGTASEPALTTATI